MKLGLWLLIAAFLFLAGVAIFAGQVWISAPAMLFLFLVAFAIGVLAARISR